MYNMQNFYFNHKKNSILEKKQSPFNRTYRTQLMFGKSEHPRGCDALGNF